MSYYYTEHPAYYRQSQQYQHHRHHPPYYRHYGNNSYHHPQHQQEQPYQAYYEYPSNAKQPYLTRSSSTGTNRAYHDREDYYNNEEYGWYYPQEIQHVPPHRRQRHNKVHSKKLLDQDGEPYTDLELLALENAAKNEILSKKLIFEEVQQADEVIEEGDDLSSAMESLTVMDSSSSTLSTMVDEENNSSRTVTPNSTTVVPVDNELKVSSKKKRWPFSFLFKPKPTKSVSTPPTPVLSPDGDSSLHSSTMTTSTTSTLFDNEEGGVWAFKCPTVVPMTPTVWIRFDKENQKKIHDHLKSNKDDDVVQFKDSHIHGGQLPVAVVPIQMRCYIPTDAEANQITFFELKYIPNK